MGANGITQATHAYFMTTFVITFWELFLEYFEIFLKNLHKNI